MKAIATTGNYFNSLSVTKPAEDAGKCLATFVQMLNASEFRGSRHTAQILSVTLCADLDRIKFTTDNAVPTSAIATLSAAHPAVSVVLESVCVATRHAFVETYTGGELVHVQSLEWHSQEAQDMRERCGLNVPLDAYKLAESVLSRLVEYSEIPEADESDHIQSFLIQHDWTRDAAAELESVARDYGTFFLTSALALAAVLGIEDGDAGF